ncbi:hypothetical protein Btru_007401 [Bulinus truncatus]|nr:hypothetical protein Btru_007401 [Bulinus truncatus]
MLLVAVKWIKAPRLDTLSDQKSGITVVMGNMAPLLIKVFRAGHRKSKQKKFLNVREKRASKYGGDVQWTLRKTVPMDINIGLMRSKDKKKCRLIVNGTT